MWGVVIAFPFWNHFQFCAVTRSRSGFVYAVTHNWYLMGVSAVIPRTQGTAFDGGYTHWSTKVRETVYIFMNACG